MALNQLQLSSEIESVLKDIANSTDKDTSSDDIRKKMADGIAEAVIKQFGNAVVTFSPGTIQVTGTAAAQANPSPVTGGKLS